MKKIIYSLMIMAGLVAMPGCNDDFMEHSPKDSLSGRNCIFNSQYVQDICVGIV